MNLNVSYVKLMKVLFYRYADRVKELGAADPANNEAQQKQGRLKKC